MDNSESQDTSYENVPQVEDFHDTIAASTPLVSSIPPELLVEIFLLYVETSLKLICDNITLPHDNPDASQAVRDHDCRPKVDGSRYWSLLTLSHVCAAWRALVMDTMAFWNRLDVAHLADAETRFGEGFIPIPSSGPLFITLDYITDCQAGGSKIADFNPERPSFLTKTIHYFIQRIFPHRDRIHELKIRLPAGIIHRLFETLLPQAGVTFASLKKLVIMFRYRRTHESADIDQSQHAVVPLHFPVLQDIQVRECVFGEHGYWLGRSMTAPQAKYLLRLFGPRQTLDEYLMTAGNTPTFPAINYKLVFALNDITFSPHNLDHSTTRTPVPTYTLMMNPNDWERGLVSELHICATSLTRHSRGALTELSVSLDVLYRAICATDLYEESSMEQDVESYWKFEQDGSPAPFLVNEDYVPTGNPYVDGFIDQWNLLLNTLSGIKLIRLLGLRMSETTSYRPSLIMPLLFSDSSPTKPVVIKATNLTRIDLEFSVVSFAETYGGRTCFDFPISFLSWLDTAIALRRLHGAPMTELNLKVVWGEPVAYLSEIMKSMYKVLVEWLHKELGRIQNEVDETITGKIETDLSSYFN